MEHKTVVRNQSCRLSSFTIRERHNERKNEHYFNGDVLPEHSHMNVHFKQHFKGDGSPETYHETFNRMLDEKIIVKRGTKPDAKLFCEMVFDINTTYFEERGGYNFAKEFYKEAYNLAVKEAGSEDYIISAVMHADERNKKLSEQYGRDIFHYHLHVVYVPIVQKEIYYRKNNKDPNLAGKLREVIPQISQNRKWPPRVKIERNGKFYTVNSYSLLQDRYHNHMKEMGYDGFERGERGSTTEHLEVLEYKIQQDTKRLDSIKKQVEKKTTQLSRLDEQIINREKVKTSIAEIDAMGKPSLIGNSVAFT
ncbi:MAG: plasmid recombination protein, partial [Oscillospiraceae bacterium]|nr:plasmid recombination protein [Oscillospiraceae bacterium]